MSLPLDFAVIKNDFEGLFNKLNQPEEPASSGCTSLTRSSDEVSQFSQDLTNKIYSRLVVSQGCDREKKPFWLCNLWSQMEGGRHTRLLLSWASVRRYRTICGKICAAGAPLDGTIPQRWFHPWWAGVWCPQWHRGHDHKRPVISATIENQHQDEDTECPPTEKNQTSW